MLLEVRGWYHVPSVANGQINSVHSFSKNSDPSAEPSLIEAGIWQCDGLNDISGWRSWPSFGTGRMETSFPSFPVAQCPRLGFAANLS